MFTGLIQNLGKLSKIERTKDALVFQIEHPAFKTPLYAGDSLAVNGVCLTATPLSSTSFRADISPETAERTSFREAKEGMLLNLEQALRLQSLLGGHLVQGHIDGLGVVKALTHLESFHRMEIEFPEELLAYLVEKGSVAVDGVSLTINRFPSPTSFELMLIPHTFENTNFSKLQIGQKVNLETDLIAKYVEKLLRQPKLGIQREMIL